MTESQDKPKQEKKTLNGLAMRLREAREKAGFLNQKSVAEKLYTTISTVSKWERGTASPPLDSLVELAALYNTTTDYLLTGSQTDHVEASRKYGLSDKALCALEEMNHTIRVDSDSVSVNSKLVGYYIHPLGYINALLSAPELVSIALDFTEHALHEFNMEDVVEHFKEIDEKNDKMSDRRDRLDKARLIAEGLGYRVVHPETVLKTEEYKLSNQWSKLFDSLLKDESILVNGVAGYIKERGVETGLLDALSTAGGYGPALPHDRPLNDEELLQLKWLLKQN